LYDFTIKVAFYFLNVVTLHVMTEKLEFSKRLKESMTKAGYQPRAVVLEREFNSRYWGPPVTAQGLRRWLLGEVIPSQDKLVVLAEWLKVEPNFLRYGTGVGDKIADYHMLWKSQFGHHEQEVFDVFLSLPPEHRKILREVILNYAKGCLITPSSGKD
jgi:hypothetical protein